MPGCFFIKADLQRMDDYFYYRILPSKQKFCSIELNVLAKWVKTVVLVAEFGG